jgi:hypothetical protein
VRCEAAHGHGLAAALGFPLADERFPRGAACYSPPTSAASSFASAFTSATSSRRRTAI